MRLAPKRPRPYTIPDRSNTMNWKTDNTVKLRRDTKTSDNPDGTAFLCMSTG